MEQSFDIQKCVFMSEFDAKEIKSLQKNGFIVYPSLYNNALKFEKLKEFQGVKKSDISFFIWLFDNSQLHHFGNESELLELINLVWDKKNYLSSEKLGDYFLELAYYYLDSFANDLVDFEPTLPKFLNREWEKKLIAQNDVETAAPFTPSVSTNTNDAKKTTPQTSVSTNENEVKKPPPQTKAQKNKENAECMAAALYLICSMQYLKDLNTSNLKGKYLKMFDVSIRLYYCFAPTRDNKTSEKNAYRSRTAIERAKILVMENKLNLEDNQKILIIKQLDKKLKLLIKE